MNMFGVLPILCGLVILSGESLGFRKAYPKLGNYQIGGDAGDPLILTPMIQAGKIKEAQEACKNTPVKSNISSYSGFFTVSDVRATYKSNMFFWFFPAFENNATAPVVLWLQGGPGASSLYGLFNENGPFSVQRKHGLKLREYTWVKSHSVLYIDNPVGTGYSFTTDAAGYSTDETAVGANLYSALIQFFTLFPELQRNDFFVTGESYAGKYVPAVSYTIHTKNPQAKLKINLKGLAIGNGLIDPQSMLKYSDYLYQIGLLDSNGRDKFKAKEQEAQNYIKQKNWKQAFLIFDSLLNGDQQNSTLFHDLTGFTFYFNYLHSDEYSPYGDIGRYLSYLEIRKNLHVGNLTFQDENIEVEKYLQNDVMQSVKPWVETLVENYRVLIYSGQLDIIVPFPSTEAFLDTLNWSGAADYKAAPRKLWYVGKELAGYAKVARKLSVVLVRNAGHMVPMDQPKWAVDLITRFTQNKPF